MDPRFAKVFIRPDFIPRLIAGDPGAWALATLAGISAIVAAIKKK